VYLTQRLNGSDRMSKSDISSDETSSFEAPESPATRLPSIRILQIAESWGGVEHNNTQLAARLSSMGHSVGITTVGERAYSRMPDRYRGRFSLEEIPWPVEKLPTFFQWYRLMRGRPADIAVLPKNWWAKGGLPLVWAAGLAYRRVVLREEVAVPELPRPVETRVFGLRVPLPRLWWLKHIAYGRLLSIMPKRIICVSDIVRERLIDQCGYPADKTVLAYNGVDTNLFRYNPLARSTVRAQLDIGESAVVIGSIGRIDNSSKRHDWSLRAFARLVSARPDADIYFVLVGEGKDRKALTDLAIELNVEHRLVLMPFTPSPWDAYSALDIFAMPSAFEAFGLASVEAMACERCAVCTAVDGMREIFSEPGIGFSVPVDDFEAFAASIQHAYELGAEGRRAMGRRARESVVRRFEADQQYASIIRHVLGPD
jgi:glycosyltransferase involved in cell wall biosynthesis